jgi:hypothetical protein
MKTKLAILAHDKASETVKEFLPYWEKLPVELEIFVPYGDKSGAAIGPSAYKGKDSLLRFALTGEALLQQDYELYIIAEYDCLPLHPIIPQHDPQTVTSAGVFLAKPDGEVLYEQLCCLPPWIVTKPMLAALIQACQMQMDLPLPEWTLEGLLDRLIGAAILTGKLPFSASNECLSHADNFAEPHKMIAATGKTWVHGWKRLSDFAPLI